MPITIPQFFASTGPMQAGLAKVIERYSKVASILPIKRMDSLVHNYAKETSLGDVGVREINVPFIDVAGSTLSPEQESIVIGGRPVSTDYRLNALSGKPRADETARTMRAISRWMDDQILNGEAKTMTRPDKVVTKGLNGLRSRCKGKQLISAGANGAQLTLDLFNAALDAVVDQGNGIHVWMNKAHYRQLKSLILATAGGAAVADVTGPIPTYEGAQLHVIGDKLNDAPTLDFDEKQGTDAKTASIYVVAPGNDDVELSGVKLLMASNSIEVIEEGLCGSRCWST